MPCAAPVMTTTLLCNLMNSPDEDYIVRCCKRVNLANVRRFAVEEVFQLIGGKKQADVEGAEQSVHRAGFIETHLVYEFFKNQRVIGEEIDPPFPIIKADGARNNLIDAAGILTSNH